MTKADFQKYKREKMFPNSIFKEYFQEVSNKEWNDAAFSIFAQNQSVFDNEYLAKVINTILIPHYNEKFRLYPVNLLDKSGVIIKELNEISEEN